MLFSKIYPVLVSVVLVMLGACGSEPEPVDDEIATVSGALTVLDQSSVAVDKLPSDGSTEFSCGTCWVRCTDDEPEQCRWTRAYDIGRREDCGKAGRTWCANHKYTYPWAGCRKAATEHPRCSCDPDGYCGKK